MPFSRPLAGKGSARYPPVRPVKKTQEAHTNAASTITGSQVLQTLRTHDVDELNHAVSGSELELIQLRPGRLEAVVKHISVAGVFVDYGRVNLPLRVLGTLDPQRFALGLFAPGARATWNGWQVDPANILFFKPGRELNGFTGENYDWTSLVMPPTWLESTAACMQRPDSLNFQLDYRVIRPDALKLAELWRTVASILSFQSSMENSADGPEWLTMDLRNALGEVISTIDRPGGALPSRAFAHFSLAHRAEHYLRERFAEPLCVDDMCVALRVSRRYLEYAFKDAFGTSPSRYLRLLRLHQVRRRLKAFGEQTTVTREATSLGFNHLSLFSVQYKQIFGESPNKTLAAVVR